MIRFILKFIFFILFLILLLLGGVVALFKLTSLPQEWVSKIVEKKYLVQEFKGDLKTGFTLKGVLRKEESDEEGIQEIGEISLEYQLGWNRIKIKKLIVSNVKIITHLENVQKIAKKSEIDYETTTNTTSEAGQEINSDFQFEIEKILFEKIKILTLPTKKVFDLNLLTVDHLLLSQKSFEIKSIKFESNYCNVNIFGKGDSHFDFQGEFFQEFINVVNKKVDFIGRIKFFKKRGEKNGDPWVEKFILGIANEKILFTYKEKPENGVEYLINIHEIDLNNYFNIEDILKINVIKSILSSNKKEALVKDSDLLVNGQSLKVRKIVISSDHLSFILYSEKNQEKEGNIPRSFDVSLDKLVVVKKEDQTTDTKKEELTPQ